MVWYGMVWYGMVRYGMVWYGMVWYGMVGYGMAQYQAYCPVVPFTMVQDGVVPWNHYQISSALEGEK
jgi:hypothetical protein